ncbi:myosin-2 essential light chain isoform X1 [Pieris rapae]|nr:myosin-2 essential light chain isoform X1 [Pieris rapae]
MRQSTISTRASSKRPTFHIRLVFYTIWTSEADRRVACAITAQPAATQCVDSFSQCNMFMFNPPTKLKLNSVEEFQEAFQLFDSRGDGKIHVAQIGDALRALGQNPTESDVKKCTLHLKPDERISFEVFLPIYQAISKARSGDTANDFIEGLRHFDKDGNGFISSAELRHLLSTLGEKLSDDEVEQLLQGQEDSHGNINYENFVHLIMQG